MPSVLLDRARTIFSAALDAVRPETLVAQEITANNELAHAIDRAHRIVVVGAGKATAGMVVGLEAALGPHLARTTGLVNIPDAVMRTTQRVFLNPCRPLGCNIESPAAVEGAARMLTLVEQAAPRDLVICLLSGGGSALLAAPPFGILLDDLVEMNRVLSAAGATIDQLNCVRKHTSRITGGQIAARCTADSLWSLIISDVLDDRLDVIASGPTTPDPTSFGDAIEVVKQLQARDRLPASILARLEAGCQGQLPETPKEPFTNVHHHILANNSTALHAARVEAERYGYHVRTIDRVQGEASQLAISIAEQLRGLRTGRRTCLLLGGETTVTLPACHGLGGRNQEFALSLATELDTDGLSGVVILAAGTDGEDGPSDAAGVMIDQAMWLSAQKRGLVAKKALREHDSYRFFDSIGGLLRTGLTGTNVADIAVILIE